MENLKEYELRKIVRQWVHQHWNPDMGLQEWRERLVLDRWAVPSWATRWYGRDLPA